MGLRIIYGRAGTGKSEYCFKEIAQKIKTEKNILIITPEQFSDIVDSIDVMLPIVDKQRDLWKLV